MVKVEQETAVWSSAAITPVGLAGFGAVGQRVAKLIDDGALGVALTTITSGNLDKARVRVEDILDKPPPVVSLAIVNVSAAVSLAGIGADRTQIRIIADPNLDRNMDDVEITGEFGWFTTHIENVPTENPRSGILTALSVAATIRKIASPLKVGT